MIAGDAELAAAAIDEQHVRQLPLALLEAPVAARERLLHGGVIVSGRHALDIEAPILALQGSVSPEDHTGGNRRLPAGVTDIEALEAPGRVGQAQGRGQGFQALAGIARCREMAGEILFGGALRGLHPARPRPTGPGADRHGAAGGRGQRRFQQLRLLDGSAEQQFTGDVHSHATFQVML